MSVIFKTLKKLKTESTEKENSAGKPVYKRRIYSFKTAFYSPSVILLLLLSFTIIGTGTLYGYYQLRGTKSENIKAFSVPKAGVREPEDIGNAAKSVDKVAINQKVMKNMDSSRMEYLPQKTDDHGVEPGGSKKPDEVKTPFINSNKASQKVTGPIKKNIPAKTKEGKSEISKNEKASPVVEVEKIFLENAKKNAKIARLVANIRWEMKQGNKKRTEEYFDELALLKGQDNSYVLKLRAVWHIQNKKYDKAKDLLKTVLTKNELDQEAGINMAIIEINTEQMENAYRRLSKLQRLYPENIRIAEIVRDIKKLYKK